MTNPAVHAIEEVARHHAQTGESLRSQRSTLARMYMEQDRAWLKVLQDLDDRITNEHHRARQAASDARAIEREEQTR